MVVPLHTQHFVMLERNLLYTALTRAKQLVVLVGDPKALGIAVRNRRTRLRHTLLAERLTRLRDEAGRRRGRKARRRKKEPGASGPGESCDDKEETGADGG